MSERKCYSEKIERYLELCFQCLCENGLENTSTRMLAEACGVAQGNLFGYYFKSKDEVIIKATDLCMLRVEEYYLSHAPNNIDEVEDYIREMPELAKKIGPEYRFAYQVFVSPKYLDYGKRFMREATQRYKHHAQVLSSKLGMPQELIESILYLLVRASVHYAQFEDQEFLEPQINLLLNVVSGLKEKHLIPVNTTQPENI
ncbi:MAG: TetR/AcrR family transcriptional regulator [Clostridiales bacterium]|nr:TetR/AcrR family transcriptional regulator [Clostridiales bacterium]